MINWERSPWCDERILCDSQLCGIRPIWKVHEHLKLFVNQQLNLVTICMDLQPWLKYCPPKIVNLDLFLHCSHLNINYHLVIFSLPAEMTKFKEQWTCIEFWVNWKIRIFFFFLHWCIRSWKHTFQSRTREIQAQLSSLKYIDHWKKTLSYSLSGLKVSFSFLQKERMWTRKAIWMKYNSF